MTEEQKNKNIKTNKKILKIFLKVSLGLVIFFIAMNFTMNMLRTPAEKAESKKNEAQLDSINVANIRIDSTNSAQTKELREAFVSAQITLKENLKDPDSYDKISDERHYIKNENPKHYIEVTIKYRAKNSFGGMNISEQCFHYDKSLNLVNTFEIKN